MQLHTRLRWIRILAVLGMLVSLLLVYPHYKEETPSLFCVIGDFFDCTIMNASPFSKVGGIFSFLSFSPDISISPYVIPVPNMLLFFFLFVVLFTITFFIHHRRPFLGVREKTLAFLAKLLLYGSAVYTIFLMYVQGYILYAYHLWYLVITVLIFASLWLFIGLHLQLHKKTLGNQRRKYRKHHS